MKLTESEFLKQLKKITEVETELTLATNLNNLEIFDSLALMSIAAWFTDNYRININVTDLEKLGSLSNLYKLIP